MKIVMILISYTIIIFLDIVIILRCFTKTLKGGIEN